MSGFLGFVTGGPTIAAGLGAASLLDGRSTPASPSVAPPAPATLRPVPTSALVKPPAAAPESSPWSPPPNIQTALASASGVLRVASSGRLDSGEGAEWLSGLTRAPMVDVSPGGTAASTVFRTYTFIGDDRVRLTTVPDATFADGRPILGADLCARIEAAGDPIADCTADGRSVEVVFDAGAVPSLEILEIPIETGPYVCVVVGEDALCTRSRSSGHAATFDQIRITHGDADFAVAEIPPDSVLDAASAERVLANLDREQLASIAGPDGGCWAAVHSPAILERGEVEVDAPIRVAVDPSIENHAILTESVVRQLRDMDLPSSVISVSGDDWGRVEADIVVRQKPAVEAGDRLLWSWARIDVDRAHIPIALDSAKRTELSWVADP